MKIVIALVVAVLVYVTFIHTSTFKQSIKFGTDNYAYSESKRGGDFKNYFYTIGGEDIAGIRQFVQIVEIPENVLPEQFEYYMRPLFSRYKLEPHKGNKLKRTGKFEQAGLKYKSYATTIEVEQQTHMIFYVSNLDERRGARQILRDLENVSFN